MKPNLISFTTWAVGALVAFQSYLASMNQDKPWVVITAGAVSLAVIILRQWLKMKGIVGVAQAQAAQAIAQANPQQPKP